jgi:hypothetical protein
MFLTLLLERGWACDMPCAGVGPLLLQLVLTMLNSKYLDHTGNVSSNTLPQ